MMKPSRPLRKRKRKDRTWAEAATLAIQLSTTKVLGIRPILQTIYDRKLKEISLNKAAENVLTTMLNHHAQLPNCPFFRVKGRYGLYALKESWLKKNSGIVPDLSDATDQEGLDDDDDLSSVRGNGNYKQVLAEVDRVPMGSMDMLARENHTFSIHGRAMPPEPHPRKSAKMVPEIESACQDSMDSLENEETEPVSSSVQSAPTNVTPNQVHQAPAPRPHLQERVYVWNSRNMMQDHYEKEQPNKLDHINLDLETPNSCLVNANMRTLLNRDTFSMLPPSYQFKLTMLLPECDRSVDSALEVDKQVLKPSQTAFTNEFFSQSLQEWKDRLGDGEFTRETRSRIAQEIAKERSKIEPWKEKFFEEFYGQKQVPIKRLRSRGSECSHLLQDFGIEAQLAKFADLRKELQETASKENLITSSSQRPVAFDNMKDKPRIKSPQNTINSIRRRTLASNANKCRNTYRMARNKFAPQKRRKLSPTKIFSGNQHFKVMNMPTQSSIVMKPSGALSVFARCANLGSSLPLNSNNNCDRGKEEDAKYLDIRKDTESGPAAIMDHSYTSTLWHKSIEGRLSVDASLSGRNSAKSSTLVLYPQGNLVNSTRAIMQSGTRIAKDEENIVETKQVDVSSFSSKDASFKIIKPSPASRPNTSSNDTERVLSICARPLTPESFVTGNTKSSNSFLTQIRQVPSPLVVDALTATSTSAMKAITASSTSQQVVLTSQIAGLSNQIPHPSKVTTASTNLKPLPTLYHTHPHSAKTTVAYVGTSLQSQQHQTPVVMRSEANSLTGLTASAKQESCAIASSNHGSISATSEVTAVRSMVNTLPLQSVPLSTSPLAPGRLTIAGIKRSQTATHSTPSPPGPSAKWGATSSPSPPLKKTRTLAEIKAQMKAKKAANAAASTRPSTVGLPQPGAVAANSHSHMFCATTFPVYFPLVTSSPSSMVIPPSTTQSLPTTASYIRLPTTATLPLERLQWVSPAAAAAAAAAASSAAAAARAEGSGEAASVGQSSTAVSVKPTGDAQTKPNEERKGAPSDSGNNKQPRGKITLKIKAAGSAISLKVDADVINKELKRKKDSAMTSDDEHDRASDEESSSNDSASEDSDEEEEDDLRMNKSRIRRSSGSESDCQRTQQRWSGGTQSGDGAVFAQSKPPCDAAPSPAEAPTAASTLLLKQQRSAAVFGVSPYNVSIKPPSTTCDASSSTTFPAANSLFQAKPSPLSFRPVPTCGSWSANMSVSTTIASNTKATAPASVANCSKPSKFKSTSKGKSMKHMQELARSSMMHSDESADDGDSSDDDDDEPGDVSTTTASENDKYTESDDSSQSWMPGHPDSAESSLSDDNNTLSKRQTHFPLKKDVKTRGSKSSTQKVLSMTTHK